MKILFFDYWLKGINNFNRLMPEIRKQIPDVEVKMIHVGSWKEPQEKLVNEHDGFTSHDISTYGTWNLYKVLKKERPDVLVMLNIYYLSDKAIITFCRKLGIKVVFLAHGKFLSDSEQILDRHVKEDLKKNFASKIRKDTINILKNYLLSTFIRRQPMLFPKSLIKLMKDPMSMTLKTKYSKELDVDRMMVYYEIDKEEFINNRNFPAEKITVVGNPEMDDFINSGIEPQESFFAKADLKGKPYVLYLDDGFVQSHIWNKDQWYAHLKEINGIVKRGNRQLILKLHPRTPMEEHKDFFSKEGIKTFKNEVSFKDLINYADSVISIYSTTISLALCLNKNVVSPRWGVTESFTHNYPKDVIYYPESGKEYMKWLANPAETCKNKIAKEEILGMRDGKSKQRIIEIIKKP